MGIKWENVMRNQIQGMDPVSAYYKEKNRDDNERKDADRRRRQQRQKVFPREKSGNDKNDE